MDNGNTNTESPMTGTISETKSEAPKESNSPIKPLRMCKFPVNVDATGNVIAYRWMECITIDEIPDDAW